MKNTFSTKPPHTRQDSDITIGRIGHSTVLMNFFGTWIITDPIFASAFGIPIPFTSVVIGVQRLRKPFISIHEIPDIDIILLSHGHMDHLHPYAFHKLQKKQEKKIHCVTAVGVKCFLPKAVQATTQELDWNQSVVLGDINITACEVHHR